MIASPWLVVHVAGQRSASVDLATAIHLVLGLGEPAHLRDAVRAAYLALHRIAPDELRSVVAEIVSAEHAERSPR